MEDFFRGHRPTMGDYYRRTGKTSGEKGLEVQYERYIVYIPGESQIYQGDMASV
jgi:hypothetical protein